MLKEVKPMERKPAIYQASGPEHGTIQLEQDDYNSLPNDRVYLDPETGRVFDSRRGNKLSDIPQGAVELPRTTWYS